MTYTRVAADVGSSISVKVTGAKPGYIAVTQASAAVAVTGKTFLMVTADFFISGTAKVGSTLSVVPSTWSAKPDTVTYQWYRGSVAIAGATRSTYTVTSTDLGKVLSVIVTENKVGYNPSTSISPGTAPVASATPARTQLPSRLGSPVSSSPH